MAKGTEMTSQCRQLYSTEKTIGCASVPFPSAMKESGMSEDVEQAWGVSMWTVGDVHSARGPAGGSYFD